MKMSTLITTIHCKELIHYISFIQNVNLGKTLAPEWEECYGCFASINSIDNASQKIIDTTYFANNILQRLFLFKLRYSNKISIDMQIRFKQRFFSIKKINNIEEKNKILQIIALEN